MTQRSTRYWISSLILSLFSHVPWQSKFSIITGTILLKLKSEHLSLQCQTLLADHLTLKQRHLHGPIRTSPVAYLLLSLVHLERHRATKNILTPEDLSSCSFLQTATMLSPLLNVTFSVRSFLSNIKQRLVPISRTSYFPYVVFSITLIIWHIIYLVCFPVYYLPSSIKMEFPDFWSPVWDVRSLELPLTPNHK